MAMPVDDFIQLLALWIWMCINQPVSKSGIYLQVFKSEELLIQMLSACSITFCPGLFEVINAASPPSVSWFKNLPTCSDTFNGWAVYALVLEKPGARAMLNIGSATAQVSGVRKRFTEYRNHNDSNTSREMRKALKQGFEITHFGMLMWSDIPSASRVPIQRVCFVAAEAALTFLFWTLKSRVKDYGMDACCPWDRSLFEYDGLNTHNPLMETPHGDVNLSAADLEAIAAHSKALRKASSIKANAKSKANIRFRCNTCKFKTGLIVLYKKHMRSTKHKRTLRDLEAGHVYLCHCEPCGYYTDHAGNFRNVHLKSTKHLKNMKEQQEAKQ